jgi:hypothetical protein
MCDWSKFDNESKNEEKKVKGQYSGPHMEYQ